MKQSFFLQLQVISLTCLLAICSAPAAEASARYRAGEPNLAALYDDVLAQLTKGKTYVYVVPFETLSKTAPDDPTSWNECTDTALPSEKGINDAQLINRAIRRLSLSVTYAQSSSSCAAFNARSFVLSGVPTVYVETEDFDPYGLLQRLNLPDAVLRTRIQGQFTNGHDGATKVMVGARMAAQVAPHPVLADLLAGETAIFVEDATDQPKLIAKLTPQQWKELADYAAHKQKLRKKEPRNSAPQVSR